MNDEAEMVMVDEVVSVAQITAPLAPEREMLSNEQDVMAVSLDATMSGLDTVTGLEGATVTDVSLKIPDDTVTMLWAKEDSVNWKEICERTNSVAEVKRVAPEEREVRFFVVGFALPEIVILEGPLNDVAAVSAECAFVSERRVIDRSPVAKTCEFTVLI